MSRLRAFVCILSVVFFVSMPLCAKTVKVGETEIYSLSRGATRYLTIEERASLTNAQIRQLLEDSVTDPEDITFVREGDRFDIVASGKVIFSLTPEETGLLPEETEAYVQQLTEKLRTEFGLTKKRALSASLLTKFFFSFIYPVILIVVIIGLRFFYRSAIVFIYRQENGLQLGRFEIMSPVKLRMFLKVALVCFTSLVILAALYFFLAATFYYFPVTRGYALWMYALTGAIWASLWHSSVAIVWRLALAVLVAIVAFALVNTIDKLFDEIEDGKIQPAGFIKFEHIDIFEYLAKAAIVLLGVTFIVMLLPGKGGQFGTVVLAFAGLSMAFGFVPVLKNAAAGFMIAFSKTHHRGAVLIIDGHEAVIMRTGVFFTSLRFANGEIHQLPNRQILKGRTRTMPSGDIVTWTGRIKIPPACLVSEIQQLIESWALSWSESAMSRVTGIDNSVVEFELKMPYLQSSSEVFVAAAFDGLGESLREKQAELLGFRLKT